MIPQRLDAPPEYSQHGRETREEVVSGILIALEYLKSECDRNDLPEVALFTGVAADICKEALETPNQALAYGQLG